MKKNMEWWKNIKKGDEFELDVANGINNDWKFAIIKGKDKKYKTVYFDDIWYPPDDIKKYSDPMLKFQTKKEDIDNKMTSVGITLSDIKNINSYNGEKLINERKVRNVNNLTHNTHSTITIDVYEINGKWACPCYNPNEPNKFLYSQKSNARMNHKKYHIIK